MLGYLNMIFYLSTISIQIPNRFLDCQVMPAKLANNSSLLGHPIEEYLIAIGEDSHSLLSGIINLEKSEAEVPDLL